jgi:hypothetical protein
MWHLGEHQRPSQDVQFDHLVVVDPNVRNVIAAKAPAMSWLTRYSHRTARRYRRRPPKRISICTGRTIRCHGTAAHSPAASWAHQ